MNRTVKSIVGTRQLQVEGKRNKVVSVVIGKPKKSKRNDWMCPYIIRGISKTKIRYAYGVDSVQSLLLAIDGIRSALEKSGIRLSWIGGEPGDTGFTRFVPPFFGLAFSKRIERLIDREIARFSRSIKKAKIVRRSR